jgi:hypothetical protein
VQTILVDQFTNLRDGDSFWYQRIFSGHELQEIENTTLADVIERNTEITGLSDNVFFVESGLDDGLAATIAAADETGAVAGLSSDAANGVIVDVPASESTALIASETIVQQQRDDLANRRRNVRSAGQVAPGANPDLQHVFHHDFHNDRDSIFAEVG